METDQIGGVFGHRLEDVFGLGQGAGGGLDYGHGLALVGEGSKFGQEHHRLPVLVENRGHLDANRSLGLLTGVDGSCSGAAAGGSLDQGAENRARIDAAPQGRHPQRTAENGGTIGPEAPDPVVAIENRTVEIDEHGRIADLAQGDA